LFRLPVNQQTSGHDITTQRGVLVTGQRRQWDHAFKAGSLITSRTLGYMLGRYVLAFQTGWVAQGFAVLSGICVSAAFAYIGGAWLVMKSEGELQIRAAYWSRRAGWFAALGIAAISVMNPLVSADVAERWLSMPAVFLLIPIPLVCLILVVLVDQYLKQVPTRDDVGCWFPFVAAALLFLLNFLGLAYSFFPYVVPGKLTAAEAASATASLQFIGVGVAIVLPLILTYTAFAYRVFWGKSTELKYY